MAADYCCASVYVGQGLRWEDIKRALDLAFKDQQSLTPTVDMNRMMQAMAQLGQPGSLLELKTSGTLGDPKTIFLSKEALVTSHQMVEEFFGNPKKVQWLLTLVPDKIAGMQVLIRSYLSGTEPTIMKDLTHFTAESFCEAVARMPRGGHRRVSLVPTQLIRLLEDHKGTKALQSFDAVLVGGASTSQDVQDKARQLGIKVYYTYGMTETAGGCVYNGKPLPGVQLSLSDRGRIVISGPMLANGKGPDFETEDKGTITKDGTVEVWGRVGDVINSGGIKISAQEVSEKIRTLPGVHDAYVVGANDQEWGQRLIAFVQGNTTEEEIRQVTGSLGKAAVPKHIKMVDEIPYLTNGKPDRQKLITWYTNTMPKPTLAQWLEGARLRTFPLSLAPIIAGTAAAKYQGYYNLWFALLCFCVALFLQIGVNYSNDYSDGIRGTDDNRVGPLRLTGSGVASPEQVKRAAFISFGIACLAGLVLVALSSSWWLLLIGVLAVFAAWGYTGGKNPYGYRGLGEIFVFVFFGLVATLGTEYVQAHRVSFLGILVAIGVGCFACAVLVANNLRDVHTDVAAGKNTLAVRLGEQNTRIFYIALIILPYALLGFVILPHPWLALVFISALLAIKPCQIVLSGARGLKLIPVLKTTGFVSVAYSIMFAISLIVGK